MTNINYFIVNNKRNIKTILISQLFSNLTSLIILFLGLFYINPDKYVGIQLVMSYLVFSGFIHLGLIDGIELRISGNPMDKKPYGFYILTLFILSSLPSIIYFIFYYENFDTNILVAFLAFPLINLNAFFVVLLRSFGFSWIAARGVIYEKIIVIFYLLFTATYTSDYIIFFIFAAISPFLYYVIKSYKIGISFDFGIDINTMFSDLKNGSTLMMSNILYSIISSGSIIIAAKYYNNKEVSKLAIAISFINLFIGLSTQFSNVLFPLLSNQKKISGKVNHDGYIIILEKYVPLLVVLAIICLYFGDFFLKDLYTKKNILKYVFLLIPITYFEIKNQILNIIIIKLTKQINNYLIINFSSALVCVLSLLFSNYYFDNDILMFLYALIFSFIFRFIILSLYCRTIRYLDYLLILLFCIYLYILKIC
ncbi:hypothetical protein [Flavobacterium sp. LS1R10]|uniref:hypothetical protein n=1 Tax=Flavobacterium sp. LS1R10 TaxID=2497482 RepID=UPI000F8266FD|nr:hypothetical protein [Flavobacterium sp. LS1R10]RTY74269.1 hypothetical protein EKL96_09400 [Flavobacterium sp. LS1R10]